MVIKNITLEITMHIDSFYKLYNNIKYGKCSKYIKSKSS